MSGRLPPRRWLTMAMMATVFISGAVIGSGSTMIVINRRVEEASNRHWNAACERMLPTLRSELDLNDGQYAEVEQIIRRHFAKLNEIRDEVIRPAIREEFAQMENQVSAVLDEQQNERWTAWLEERRKRVCASSAHRKEKKADEAPQAAEQKPAP
ncbi:MAG TPA: hypothetical protein VJ783_17390 [Pirellulales bacterium]|nr:hypothetical protein [Pirellulales bacterium]